MSNEFIHAQPVTTDVELELMQNLLDLEHTPYPWNPTEPNADEYFRAAEQTFTWDNWQPHEIHDRAQAFMGQLNQLWVQQSVLEQFAARIPTNILQSIVQQAHNVLARNLSAIDQLVECVCTVLPNWESDDLQVLARPLALAMRSAEAEAAGSKIINSIQPSQWQELSEVEQAKLSLAIAHHTLRQLQQSPEDLANESF